MGVFIQGTGSISAQGTHEEGVFLEPVREYEEALLRCVEPDYKEFIPSRAARRMSRLVKMGLSSAMLALQRAGVEKPEAILAGTGLGCMEETEKFLESMIDQQEQMLNPTAFIQSTHNSIAGQLAISLGCKGYNHTYVHRALSFPSAVLDASLLLREGEASKALVGGFDETTDDNFFLFGKIGQWKKSPVNTRELLEYGTSGSVAGEGANFFLLTTERDERTLASLDDLELFYRSGKEEGLQGRVEAFLERNKLSPGDIDAVIYGYSGDQESDRSFDELRDTLFDRAVPLHYKFLSGEYHTASAFALWAGGQALHYGKVPASMRLDESGEDLDSPRRILVCDHYFGHDHSLFLLSR